MLQEAPPLETKTDIQAGVRDNKGNILWAWVVQQLIQPERKGQCSFVELQKEGGGKVWGGKGKRETKKKT